MKVGGRVTECGRKGWEKLRQFRCRGFHFLHEVEASLPAVQQGGGGVESTVFQEKEEGLEYSQLLGVLS